MSEPKRVWQQKTVIAYTVEELDNQINSLIAKGWSMSCGVNTTQILPTEKNKNLVVFTQQVTKLLVIT